MSEVVDLEGGITRPAGFTAAGVACGIKESGNRDLSLVHSAVPARSAAVFTASDLWGAPLVVSRRHLQNGVAQAVVANSGCANTCTGSPGEDDAVRMAQVAGSSLGISPYDVIVASTGLIGSRLPMDRIERGIEAAVNDLGEKGHLAAAEGILTTDTAVKEAACGFSMGDSEIGVGGMAKGAGMIGPKMSAGARGPGEATMLAFITTDALVDPGFLQECLGRAVDNSFNMITVDGDTSPNDMVAVLANGAAGNKEITAENGAGFEQALSRVAGGLARQIVKDAEGATKLVLVRVEEAESVEKARRAVLAVSNSPLVKTAFFGEDPNWGRLLAALGRAGIAFEVGNCQVFFGPVQVVRDGLDSAGQEEAAAVLKQDEFLVRIVLGQGQATAAGWTSDLSYDYVRINADYRT